MKHFRYATAAVALSLAAGAAQAGGVDRSGQSVIRPLFKAGNYAEIGFGSVRPSVSGTSIAPTPIPGSRLGADSDNMSEPYFVPSGALKLQITPTLSFAAIADRPFGAKIAYDAGTGYYAGSADAELRTKALTMVLKYDFSDRISVFGGARNQDFQAAANIPYVTAGPPNPLAGTPYTARSEASAGWGYLVGAAYQVPDIALRVALTYNSSVTHDLETTESSVAGLNRSSITEIETPESVNLEFQTGVAPGTLVFGSVRWVNWSDFDITPADYQALTSLAVPGGLSLVSYET